MSTTNGWTSDQEEEDSPLDDWEYDDTEVEISDALSNELVNRLTKKGGIKTIEKKNYEPSLVGRKERKYYCPSFLQNEGQQKRDNLSKSDNENNLFSSSGLISEKRIQSQMEYPILVFDE